MDFEELQKKLNKKVYMKKPVGGRNIEAMEFARGIQEDYLFIVELICDALKEYDKMKSS